MAKTPNYNWTTYEDGTTRINFQGDISNFIKDVDNILSSHTAENVTQGNPHGIDAKANKAQANWITGTLQNGWTGTFRYRKNDLNIVSLVFESIKGGTNTPLTIVASLPSGYRPRRNAAVQLMTAGGIGYKKIIYVNENGNIYIASDSIFASETHSGSILLEAEVI